MFDFSELLKNAWEKWNIRIFVLISLLLQICLTMFASGRKRIPSKPFNLFIWSIYLLADWVATFTLGLLSRSQGHSQCDEGNGSSNMKPSGISTSTCKLSHNYNDNLLAFWAPFLLLHLGGPDTITAFAMEDNELWPRHSIGLVFQVSVVFHAFVLSPPHNKLLAPTLIMFFVGIIKYSERTYALYLASMDNFRDSIVGKLDILVDPLTDILKKKNTDRFSMAQAAHKLFMFFKGIIADHFDSWVWDETCRHFITWRGKEAVKVIECELSFVYDVFFTKAALVHKRIGYVLRVVCSCSIMATSVLFFLSNKHGFGEVDIAITYTLLGGAICLDALAYVMLILSNWTIINLERFKFRFVPNIISRFIAKFPLRDQWSKSVTQHSLIDFCLPQRGSYLKRVVDRPSFFGKVHELLYIQRLFEGLGIHLKLFDELQYTWRVPVTNELMEFIFQVLKKKAIIIAELRSGANRPPWDETMNLYYLGRGAWTLKRMDCLRRFQYSVEVKFEKSLLMWHIATDLCYYTDEDTSKENDDKSMNVDDCMVSKHRQHSKIISDYMSYLLVMRPSMIGSASANWHVQYEITCKQCKDFFSHKHTPHTKEGKQEAYRNMLSVERAIDITEYRYYKSVLSEGIVLAKKLKKLEVQQRWELTSEIWVEMLSYAADRCPGIAHVQVLGKGGELLTFVKFMINHLCLAEEYWRDIKDLANSTDIWIESDAEEGL